MAKEVIGLISMGRNVNQHFRGMGPIAYLADLTDRMWCIW